jgi:flavin-dependent dehydrogenase
MTGEGIYYAVKSAKIAAETVLRALGNGPVDLSSYTARVNAEITRDLRYAHLLASLLYRLPRLCFHFFVRSPSVQWRVADALCGRTSFESLCYQLLRSSPKILLSGLGS